jgi:hypothetical protein
MDTQFGFAELLTVALGDMAKAVSNRGGEGEAQQFARCQTAAHMVMSFLPRDVTEVLPATFWVAKPPPTAVHWSR